MFSAFAEGMNKLPAAKRITILDMLVEGMSMRSICRTAGVSVNPVTKLMVEAGEACSEHRDMTVSNVKARQVECDAIWSFCCAK